MSTLGCSLPILALLTLSVGFVPFLTWINVAIALPLAVIWVFVAIHSSRKPNAQSADRASVWFAVGLVAVVALRIVTI